MNMAGLSGVHHSGGQTGGVLAVSGGIQGNNVLPSSSMQQNLIVSGNASSVVSVGLTG